MRFEWLTSSDNQLATSIDLPDGDGPWPIVIIVHGLTGNRLGRSYHKVEFARRLAAAGIGCVRFDQSGCGESTGDFKNVTLETMRADAEAVRDWTIAQPWCDAERLGWVALSLGALPTVAVEGDHPAGAVALWGPVFDLPRVFGETAKTGLRAIVDAQGWVPYRGLPVGAGLIDHLDAIDPAEALRGSDAAVLILHGRHDDVAPFREAEAYRDACRAAGRYCELVASESADHDFSDYPDRQYLLARTLAFLTEHLTGARA